jgi:general secretion pathway protein N
VRLDQARPITWLLALVGAWAVLGWLLALAGMGAWIAPSEDDPVLGPLPAQATSSLALRSSPLAQYAEVIARPLFAQDRRPHPFVLPSNADESTNSSDAFDYVLSSVMMAPGFRMAIVEPAQGGTSITMRQGEAVDAIPGWRLVELQPRSAVFEGPGGRRALELRVWTRDGEAVPATSARTIGAVTTAAPAPSAVAAETTNASTAAMRPARASAPVTPQMQIDAIRERIEARRALLRQQAAQPTAPASKP